MSDQHDLGALPPPSGPPNPAATSSDEYLPTVTWSYGHFALAIADRGSQVDPGEIGLGGDPASGRDHIGHAGGRGNLNESGGDYLA